MRMHGQMRVTMMLALVLLGTILSTTIATSFVVKEVGNNVNGKPSFNIEEKEIGNNANKVAQISMLPLRGWNSYDAFDWIVSEEQFLSNVDYVAANLTQYGYNIVTVDFYWYLSQNGTTYYDKYGRLQPDPARWPSSNNGNGFKTVADYVHKKGLLFGIHIMRGISQVVVKANTPVMGTNKTASQIVDTKRMCEWSFSESQFYAIDMTQPEGQVFYNSLFEQYAEWGVDFIKNDCVYGQDFELDQIQGVSNAISSNQRQMLLSLSPGSSDPNLAKQVAGIVNMYRVTGDTWDNWANLKAHFDAAVQTQPFIGFHDGRYNFPSWPDLDMLPLGYICKIQPTGPDHFSYLTQDEQVTMITLWSIFRAPMMYGGDLRSPDPFSLSLITNPVLLDLSNNSGNNSFVYSNSTQALWVADSTTSIYSYVAVFNLEDTSQDISFLINRVTWKGSMCEIHNVWTGTDYGNANGLTISLSGHQCALFRLSGCSTSTATNLLLL